MQTRPRPPADEQGGQPPAPPPPRPRSGPDRRKLLNTGLLLAGLGLAFVYVSRGAGFYDYLPGGRKILFAAGLLTFAGLAAARLWPADGRAGLRRAAERAWVDPRLREYAPVGLLVGVALAVRLWGANFGLPYLEHVDEWNVAERALHMVQTGSFDPHDYRHPGLADNDRQAFTYPTLTTYLQTGVFTLRFLQGVAAGQYDGTSIMAAPSAKADFYLWGRAFTALLGAATVGLLYLVARRAYGRGVGLAAALFLTFFYLHALNSRWLTTDVPSGFMALLPFLFIWPVLAGREERRYYLLAGLTAGLAVATKYNNALILAPLVLAHLLGRPWRRWPGWNLPLAGLAALAGFSLGAPFVWLRFPQFLTDLAAVITHYQTGHAGFEASDNWRQYINFMLADNAAVVLLGLGGVALAAARHSRADLTLLAFPLLTYLQLSSYRVNFSRNLMPVIPFLCLFAGLLLVESGRWLAGRRPARFSLKPRLVNPALAGLALLAVAGPALTILSYDAYNSQPTNRARATRWLEQNAPRGSKLWLEPFSTDLLPRAAYRLEGGRSALDNPPEWYRANGFHYLVLSEAYYKEAAQSGSPAARAGYRALTDGPYPAGLEPVQDFKKNNLDRPGARIVILKTGLPLLVERAEIEREARPAAFDFGGQLRLAGWQAPAGLKPGAAFYLTLYWETLRRPDRDYTVFIHVLDGQDRKVAQLDLAPFAGTRPTSIWQPGQTVRDDYPLKLPDSLPPGSYRVAVGLYQAPNGPRLTLPGGPDQAIIGPLAVTGTG